MADKLIILVDVYSRSDVVGCGGPDIMSSHIPNFPDDRMIYYELINENHPLMSCLLKG